jgi:virginiamycin B lyase
MSNDRARTLAGACALLAVLLATPLEAQHFTYYTVTTGSSGPWGITSGNYGRLYFTEFYGNNVASIQALTCNLCDAVGTVHEFPIPTMTSYPKGVALGQDGDIYFVESNTARVAKLPVVEGGSILEQACGAFPQYITAGPDGAVYFTETNANKVGRWTYTGAFSEHTSPVASSGPTDISCGLDGTLYYVLSLGDVVAWRPVAATESTIGYGAYGGASNVAANGTTHRWVSMPSNDEIDMDGFAFGVETYLATNSGPARIIAGHNDDAWFLEVTTEKLGHVTSAGKLTEYPLPSGSQPKDLAVGPDGDVWITLFGTNKIARFTTRIPGDVNDDGTVNTADLFYLINFLYVGGPAPK